MSKKDDLSNLQRIIKPLSFILLTFIIITAVGLTSSSMDNAVDTEPGEIFDFLSEIVPTGEYGDNGDDGNSKAEEPNNPDGFDNPNSGLEDTQGSPDKPLPMDLEDLTGNSGGDGGSSNLLKLFLIFVIILIGSIYYYKKYYKNKEKDEEDYNYETIISDTQNEIENIYGEIIKNNKIDPSKSPEEVRNILINDNEYIEKQINNIIDKFVKSKYSGEEIKQKEINKVKSDYKEIKDEL